MTPRSPEPYGGPADVLGLFAHPDDETFGPGGTLARLAAEGHTAALCCATRGEAGTIGVSRSLGREGLAAVRTEELHAACRALGVTTPRVLRLPDGGLEALDAATLVRPFVEAVRRHRPRVLVTFEPGGISGHPDHRTVTRRAAEAFEAAARDDLWPELGPPHAAERLWAYAVRESYARLITYRTLHAVPDGEVDAVVDVSAFVSAKRAAVAAHATQKPFIERLEAFLGGLDGHWREEAFVLLAARAPIPDGARPLDHLLAGLPARG